MENSDIFFKYYDLLFAEKDYMGEIKSIMELASAEGKIHRILEIGSGTGNHTFCCASLGCEVIAVDIDERMVKIAEDKRKASSSDIAGRVRFFKGPVEDLPFADFDLAIAMFNVVNYISSLADLQVFMNGIVQRLKPKALFIFDVWNGIAAVLDPPRNEIRHIDAETHNIRIDVKSETDYMELRTNLIYEMEITEKTSGAKKLARYETQHTLWPPKVIRDVAEFNGFEVESINTLSEPMRSADVNDWKVLFLCRKR